MELLYGNVQRFRGGLVFKAHKPLHHSILGLRVGKKKKGVVDCRENILLSCRMPIPQTQVRRRANTAHLIQSRPDYVRTWAVRGEVAELAHGVRGRGCEAPLEPP